MSMLTWDITTMFRQAGGDRGVIELCKRVVPTRKPPTVAQVGMWKSRRIVAAEWLPVICAGLLASGMEPVELFMRTDAVPQLPPALPRRRGRPPGKKQVQLVLEDA